MDTLGSSKDNNTINETESTPSSSTKFNSQKWDEFLKSTSSSDSANNKLSDDEEFIDATDQNETNAEEVDEEMLGQSHKGLSEEQLQKLRDEAMEMKEEGNIKFKEGNCKDAVNLYTRALNVCPLTFQNDRSILYANRAAARMNLDQKDDAILDCNKALELNPQYMKALVRRAQLHRKTDNLERSLEDYKKILELDPGNGEARQACTVLPPEIHEKNEKLKQEMFGKLKELGNMCLKPFGLSTDNFQVVQDPNTGGYSVNFQQNNT